MEHDTNPAPSASNPARRPTVLVVEDEPMLGRLLEVFLEQKGLGVLIASNGEEGLAVATRAIPDLILTDLMLPIMDGRELRSRLRTNPRTAHIPVFLLSAAAAFEGEDTFTGVIPKPFALDHLFERIRPYIS